MPGRGEKEVGSGMGKDVLEIFSSPQRQCRQAAPASRRSHHGPRTWHLQPMCTHSPPCAVVDKTFTNLVREKCGHLYCCIVKLDISAAIGTHESQKEAEIQMDINVH